MLVNGLVPYLYEEGLVQTASLDSFSNTRIAVDGSLWLGKLLNTALEEHCKLYVATGGWPLSIASILQRELKLWNTHRISPVVVFSGLTGDNLLDVYHPDQDAGDLSLRSMQCKESVLKERMRWVEHIRCAWEQYDVGEVEEAVSLFEEAEAKIRDMDNRISHTALLILKQRGIEAFRAPYLSSPQLTWLHQQGLVDDVWGGEDTLIYESARRIILEIDFERNVVEFVEGHRLMNFFQLYHDQFIDVCILSGIKADYAQLPMCPPLYGDASTTASFRKILESMQTYKVGMAVVSSAIRDSQKAKEYMKLFGRAKSILMYSPVLTVGHYVYHAHHSNGSVSSGGSACEPSPPVQKSMNDQTERGKEALRQKRKRQSGCVTCQPLNMMKHAIFSDTVYHYHQHAPADLHVLFGPRLPDAVYFFASMGCLSVSPCSTLSSVVCGTVRDPFLYSSVTPALQSLLISLLPLRCEALLILQKLLHHFFSDRSMVYSRCEKVLDPVQYHTVVEKAFQSAIENGGLMCGLLRHQTSTLTGSTDHWMSNLDLVHLLRLAPASRCQRGGSCSSADLISLSLSCLEGVYSTVLLNCLILLEYLSPEISLTPWGYALQDINPHWQEEALIVLELLKSGYFTNAFVLEEGDFEDGVVELLCAVMSLIPVTCEESSVWSGPLDSSCAVFNSAVRAVNEYVRDMMEVMTLQCIMHENALISTEEAMKAFFSLPFIHENGCWMGIVVKALLLQELSVQDAAEYFPMCSNLLRDVRRAASFWQQIFSSIGSLHEQQLVADSLFHAFESANDVFLHSFVSLISGES